MQHFCAHEWKDETPQVPPGLCYSLTPLHTYPAPQTSSLWLSSLVCLVLLNCLCNSLEYRHRTEVRSSAYAEWTVLKASGGSGQINTYQCCDTVFLTAEQQNPSVLYSRELMIFLIAHHCGFQISILFSSQTHWLNFCRSKSSHRHWGVLLIHGITEHSKTRSTTGHQPVGNFYLEREPASSHRFCFHNVPNPFPGCWCFHLCRYRQLLTLGMSSARYRGWQWQLWRVAQLRAISFIIL